MEMLKRKLDLMEQLLEIQHANRLLKESDEAKTKTENIVDSNYEKLKCDLVAVDKSSDEMDMLRKYVKNTHAKTHSTYTLDIDSAFRVAKHGEEERTEPFKDLHNRRLLWHGSRLTNWVGILSQGSCWRVGQMAEKVWGEKQGSGERQAGRQTERERGREYCKIFHFLFFFVSCCASQVFASLHLRRQ